MVGTDQNDSKAPVHRKRDIIYFLSALCSRQLWGLVFTYLCLFIVGNPDIPILGSLLTYQDAQQLQAYKGSVFADVDPHPDSQTSTFPRPHSEILPTPDFHPVTRPDPARLAQKVC